MKKIFTLCWVLMATAMYGQTPFSFKYQAAVRDMNQNLIQNQQVSFRFSILEDATSGTLVYKETHTQTTSEIGIVSLNIGMGQNVVGQLEAIDWAKHSYYLQVEFDKDGGNNYQLMGTSQILAVPYALHAKTAELAGPWNVDNNDVSYHDGEIHLGNMPTFPNFGDGPLKINYAGYGGGAIVIRNTLSNKNAGITFLNDSLASVHIGITGSNRTEAGSGKNYAFLLTSYGDGTSEGLIIGNRDIAGKIIFADNGQPIAEFVDGNLYVKNPAKGIVLKAPNGFCYRITVDNVGELVTTPVSCSN